MRIQIKSGWKLGVVAAAFALFGFGCKNQGREAAEASLAQPMVKSEQVETLARESGYAATGNEKDMNGVATNAAQQAADKINQQRQEVERAAE